MSAADPVGVVDRETVEVGQRPVLERRRCRSPCGRARSSRATTNGPCVRNERALGDAGELQRIGVPVRVGGVVRAARCPRSRTSTVAVFPRWLVQGQRRRRASRPSASAAARESAASHRPARHPPAMSPSSSVGVVLDRGRRTPKTARSVVSSDACSGSAYDSDCSTVIELAAGPSEDATDLASRPSPTPPRARRPHARMSTTTLVDVGGLRRR